MFQADKKPILFNKESTGNPITFNSRLKNMPLSKCEITIPISQQGSGTPSPDNIREFNTFSSVDFTKAGKNLFSGQNITENVYITPDGNINHYADWNVSDYIPVSANTVYTFTPNSTSGNKAHNAFYDSNKNLLSVSSTSNFTFTTPENCKFVRLSFRSSSYDIQFEHSAATAYEAYNGNTFLISFGQPIYSGVVDVKTGILAITHAILDLGDLGYQYRDQYELFYSSVNTSVKLAATNCACSGYLFNPDAIGSSISSISRKINDKEITTFSNENNQGRFVIKDTNYTDVASLKEAIAGIKLVYELATPIEVVLEGHTIEAVKGVNNIFASIGNTTVNYVEVK